jgi:hypothetical protein
MDYLIKDTLHRILDEADAEMIGNMAKMINLPPETLDLIRSYLDEELNRFYNKFLREEESDES